MYRLVALDVDGTLLDSQHQLPSHVQTAVRAARSRDVQVTLATGKLFASIVPLIEQLDLTGPQITCNGAAILDARSQVVISSIPLIHDELASARAALDRHAPGIAIAWYTETAILTDAPYGYLDEILTEYREPKIQRVARLDSSVEAPLKLLVTGTTFELDRLRSAIEPELAGRVRVVRTSIDFLEFMSLETNKGFALERVQTILGISRAETMAIGDGENDIPLIGAAGMGVAMGNAVPDLVARAQSQTTTNDAGGVAATLTSLLIA